jgi:hypothetical protein
MPLPTCTSCTYRNQNIILCTGREGHVAQRGRSEWKRQLAAQRREAERQAREAARYAKEQQKAQLAAHIAQQQRLAETKTR